MSIQAVAWAIKVKVGSPTKKAVLIVLCNYADQDGYCWPSQETIASDTELTDRSIRTALAALEEEGFIERSARPRRPDSTRQSDMIRIVFSRVPCPTTRKELPGALPETPSETIRKDVPNHPETVSGKPSGEPLIEPPVGARARARPSLLPENWKPNPQHVAVGVRYGLNANQLDREARRFVLHHRSIGRPLLDWDAAWERWIDKAAEMLGIAAAPQLPIGHATGSAIAGHVYAEAGSLQLEAWRCWKRETTGKPGPTDAKGGWWFPGEWPPDHQPREAAA